MVQRKCENRQQHRTTLKLKNITLLESINLSIGEGGHPVAQNCSIPPLEQDAKSSPEVGDGFPLQLTSVPCQGYCCFALDYL